jgi:hypothetical protein
MDGISRKENRKMTARRSRFVPIVGMSIGEQEVAGQPLKRTGLALAMVIVLTFISGAQAVGHQTQGSPTDSSCVSGQGKMCVHDSTRSPLPFATYTGSDADYAGNVYPGTAWPLNQSATGGTNRGSTCTVWLRDLANFGGWSYAIVLGSQVGFGSGSTQYRDTSSHHWCNPS